MDWTGRGSQRCEAPEPASEILRSIQRAGEIRGSHHALTRLLDARWVPGYGHVTLNEYLPGDPAAAAVPGLPLERVLIVAIHALDALEHIHRNGSCHGDICSGNVIITGSGDGYLLDFDLAGHFPALRRTHYSLAHLGAGTLAAWQAADVRAFAAMLAGWLEFRRAVLREGRTDSGEQERELASIRRLSARLIPFAKTTRTATTEKTATRTAGIGGAAEMSAEMSQAIRRAV